jgi:tetratricopeptide (TPR) repeat protein
VYLLVAADSDGNAIGSGTGFVVSTDGLLVTNHHVLEHAASLIAKAENGGLFRVEGIVAADPVHDLAILKLEGNALPALVLGSSANVVPGSRIAVVGSPLGLEGTVSEGIVSAVREHKGTRIIQISAAISPGSSGSPVMDQRGDVIGVATAIMTDGQSLNFAVPVEFVNTLLAHAKSALEPVALPGAVARNERSATPSQAGSSGTIPRVFEDRSQWATEWQASLDRKDFVTALNIARETVEAYPNHAWAFGVLAQTYVNMGFLDDAIAAFRSALAVDPSFTEAWLGLGGAQEAQGKPDQAIATYRSALKAGADAADTWCAIGDIHSHTAKTADAVAAYKEAIRINPDHADSWHGLGVVLGDGMNLLEESAIAFRHALKLRPESARSWFGLAFDLNEMGRFDEAAQAFDVCLELDPSIADAWYLRGLISEQNEHNADKAIGYYVESLRLTRNKISPWMRLGMIYLNRKDFSSATRVLSEGIEANSDNSDVWILWECIADAYHSLREVQDRIHALEEVIRLNPGRISAWSRLVVSYWFSGDGTGVERALRELESRSPEEAGRVRAQLEETARSLNGGY